MKKLIKLAVVLVVILVVIGAVGLLSIDSFARSRVETATTTALGVQARLNALTLKIFGGECNLSGLNIANPEGYTTPHFLKLDNGGLSVAVASLLGEQVEVPTLHLDGVEVYLEKKAGKANYDVILANLSGPADAAPRKGKKFVIREVVIRNINVHADVLPIGGAATRMNIVIPEIRLKDLGSDTSGGVVLSQVSGTVMKAIFVGIAQKGGNILPAEIGNELRKGVDQLSGVGKMGVQVIGDVTQGLTQTVGQLSKPLGDVTKPLGDGAKDLTDNAGKLLDGVGNILPRKKD